MVPCNVSLSLTPNLNDPNPKNTGLSGQQQGPTQTPEKLDKGPGALGRTAGYPLGIGKVWQRPQGTLERSRAPPVHPQSPPNAKWNSGGQQSPLPAQAKPTKGPRHSREKQDPTQVPAKHGRVLGLSGEQQGPLPAAAKLIKGPGALGRSAGPCLCSDNTQQGPEESLEGSKAPYGP